MGFVAGGREPWERVGKGIQTVSSPSKAFQALLTNSGPVLPRKYLSNTWGKAPSFPSFLGCCLSERLRHFVLRKTGLKIMAWSEKIFVVLWETGASVGQAGKSWGSLELPCPGGCTSSWDIANSFHAWAPPKSDKWGRESIVEHSQVLVLFYFYFYFFSHPNPCKCGENRLRFCLKLMGLDSI